MRKLVISTLILSFVCSCNVVFDYKGRATKEADAWCKEMGIPVAHVSCVENDTDGDGYVSCTVKDEKGEFHALECVATPFALNSGCRVVKFRPGTF